MNVTQVANGVGIGRGYCDEPAKKPPELVVLIEELETQALRLSEGEARIGSALTRLGAPNQPVHDDLKNGKGCVANDNAILRLSNIVSSVRMRANDIHELADRLEQIV